MNHGGMVGEAGARRGSTPDPVPISGLAGALRRSIIACGRAQSLDDQLDCAEMACELGYTDAARVLYEGVFIQRGFSARQMKAQAVIAARTGLWGEEALAAGPAQSVTAEFAIDLALDELRQLIERAPRLDFTPPRAVEGRVLVTGLPVAVDERSAERDRTVDSGIVIDLTRRLYASLLASDVARIDTLLEELGEESLGRLQWHLRDHADASITELAAGVTANQLSAFFDKNRELCFAPFGSGVLFAAAARLPVGGLGSYFINVKQLLRSPKDLIGLVLLAGADDGSGRSPRFQQWLVLLATHLDGEDRIRLADELADLGLVIALAGLFGATCHAADRGSRLPWIVRDAALDLGRVDLAAQAQARIAGFSPDRSEEWIVLAEVLGGVDGVAAQQALAEALRLEPEHEGALRLSVALGTDGFGAFEVLSGLGSPPWRVALRAGHRPTGKQTSGAELTYKSVLAAT